MKLVIFLMGEDMYILPQYLFVPYSSLMVLLKQKGTLTSYTSRQFFTNLMHFLFLANRNTKRKLFKVEYINKKVKYLKNNSKENISHSRINWQKQARTITRCTFDKKKVNHNIHQTMTSVAEVIWCRHNTWPPLLFPFSVFPENDTKRRLTSLASCLFLASCFST